MSELWDANKEIERLVARAEAAEQSRAEFMAQLREATDLAETWMARAEAAEQREVMVRHALNVAWPYLDPFQMADEDEQTIIAALEAKP